jgi:endonuclease/exonuclease/phosphatase family metal-dependent hydrolase
MFRHTLTATLLAAMLAASASAQPLRVATFNLRYANEKDSGNLWKDRLPAVAALIRYHGFDIMGTQEALNVQLEDLSAALPGFARHGIGRDDGRQAGEHSAIFYRTDRFELLDKGDFWLSPTPGKPGPGWDATLNRLCSWVRLRDRQTGMSFHVFNAHYDHRGVQARIESSRLVLRKVREVAGDGPAVFMGDLNGGRQSEWYRELAGSGILKDSHALSPTAYEPNGSFNGFRHDAVQADVIDHIFVTRHFTADRWAVLTDTYRGRFPSDHFPVTAVLALQR